MFLSIALAALTLAGSGGPSAAAPVEARFGVTGSEVVLSIGPLHVPAATHYHHHHHPDERVEVVWPATGWLQGYSIELVAMPPPDTVVPSSSVCSPTNDAATMSVTATMM